MEHGEVAMHDSRPNTAIARTRISLVVLMLATMWAGTGSARAQLSRRYELADLKALERAFVELAENVRPSVVSIQTYLVPDSNAMGTRSARIPANKGSGFIIGEDGYIATNRHVLEAANDFSVVLHDGERYHATVVEADPRSDLAVLKIDAEDLVPVRWGDLAKVKVNQWTFACGNPFGLANDKGGPSVTFGMVSALGRDMTHRFEVDQRIHYYGNLIETSSAINPGNSGGPLFNADGEVIGIITAIATTSGVSEGIGFAIPVDTNTRRIIETLKTGRDVRYGYLGVSVNSVEPPSSPRVAGAYVRKGARIVAIDPPDGPAAQAGLRPGDVVIAIDGTPVEDTDHLVRLVGFSQVGAKVDITYLRQQIKRKATVTLGDRYELLGLVEGD